MVDLEFTEISKMKNTNLNKHQNMTQKNNYPRFISDKPLGEDLLGSHDKIAQSISQYFTADYPDRKLIGIDGTWGSGKSNVIEILRKKYLNENEHLFIFDAWGHQEDLQRRSILEELTSDLIDNKILPIKTKIKNEKNEDEEKDWKELLKNLLARKRETNTIVVPRLSKGIILIITALILTPIAKTISEAIKSCNLLSIIITALPALICSIWLIRLLYKGKIKKDEIYALYKGKELENTVYETISDEEPNVNEFRKWMTHLSHDLDKNKKNIIVVFDNMDRLLPEKVKALWSSIHVFFAECNYTNIWVIIPFDREHIKDAFKGDEDFEEKANHFINKTFSAIYRIPPPILTEWHKFFKLKYKEAFGNTEDSEYDIVKSIFDLSQNNITPRNIINFINGMVSEKKIEGCQVKLRYIAVFSAYKKKILENPIDEILKPTFNSNIENLFKDDNILSDNIASLVYNLPIETSRQITLILDLKKTLKDKDISRFNEYAKQKNFIEMLEKVITQEEIDLENSILTIGSIVEETIKTLDKNRLLVIWDTLCGMQQSVYISQQEFSESKRMLLLHISESRRVNFIKYLVNEISDFKDFNGANYFKAINYINSLVIEKKYNIDIISILNPIEKSPEIFLDYLKSAKEDYPNYKLTCNENDLIKLLIERIPNALNDLNQIHYIKDNFDFSVVIKRIEESLINEEITIENITNLYLLYKIIEKDRPLEFLNDGQIYSLVSIAEPSSSAYYELISMRLARGSEFPSNYNKGECLTSLDQVEESFVIEIAKRVECYKDFDDLIIDVIEWEQPLLIEVLKKIVNMDGNESILSIETLLPLFKQIHTVLDIQYPKLLQFFNDWFEEASKLVNKENIFEIIKDIEFFQEATKNENDLTNYIIETFLQHLSLVSVEKWQESMLDDSSYYLLSTYWLIEGKRLKKLPDNAITAYNKLLVSISNNEMNPIQSAYLEKLIEIIPGRSIKETIKNVRDTFINTIDITVDLFLYFSNMFVELGELKKRSDDVTRRILTPVIDDEKCLLFIISHSNFFSEIVNKAGDDSVKFKETIRRKIQLGPTIENLVDFAIKIKVEIDKAEDNDKIK
jgi:hypothetical protein